MEISLHFVQPSSAVCVGKRQICRWKRCDQKKLRKMGSHYDLLCQSAGRRSVVLCSLLSIVQHTYTKCRCSPKLETEPIYNAFSFHFVCFFFFNFHLCACFSGGSVSCTQSKHQTIGWIWIDAIAKLAASLKQPVWHQIFRSWKSSEEFTAEISNTKRSIPARSNRAEEKPGVHGPKIRCESNIDGDGSCDGPWTNIDDHSHNDKHIGRPECYINRFRYKCKCH